MRKSRIVSLTFLALLASLPAFADEVQVPIDASRAVTLARPATTVIVGNPSIADATVTDGTHLFILGRTFGTTNIIALDSKGETIARFDVLVNKDLPRTVTLYKGVSQTTYSCGRNCEQSLMIGDGAESFKNVADQISTKVGSASSTAAPGSSSR